MRNRPRPTDPEDAARREAILEKLAADPEFQVALQHQQEAWKESLERWKQTQAKVRALQDKKRSQP